VFPTTAQLYKDIVVIFDFSLLSAAEEVYYYLHLSTKEVKERNSCFSAAFFDSCFTSKWGNTK
jgi:hypothetical protein